MTIEKIGSTIKQQLEQLKADLFDEENKCADGMEKSAAEKKERVAELNKNIKELERYLLDGKEKT